MNLEAAELHFHRGLTALAQNRIEQATLEFGWAVQLEREQRAVRPQMRYLSYLGLSLARAHGATPEAIRACETAARHDVLDPEMLLNLGRVYAMAGKTTRAITAFASGLALAPGHRALREELRRLDRRRTPPLPFLDRSHPLNRHLGRLRARTPRWLRLPRHRRP
jgi:predicted Zn-dependent protease